MVWRCLVVLLLSTLSSSAAVGFCLASGLAEGRGWGGLFVGGMGVEFLAKA